VHDFWRPLYSKDAFVDGHYSVQCYLDALERRYRHYQERTPGSAAGFSDRFDAIATTCPTARWRGRPTSSCALARRRR
jgi:hydroxymethylglutaryl-CoA synthase